MWKTVDAAYRDIGECRFQMDLLRQDLENSDDQPELYGTIYSGSNIHQLHGADNAKYPVDMSAISFFLTPDMAENLCNIADNLAEADVRDEIIIDPSRYEGILNIYGLPHVNNVKKRGVEVSANKDTQEIRTSIILKQNQKLFPMDSLVDDQIRNNHNAMNIQCVITINSDGFKISAENETGEIYTCIDKDKFRQMMNNASKSSMNNAPST